MVGNHEDTHSLAQAATNRITPLQTGTGEGEKSPLSPYRNTQEQVALASSFRVGIQQGARQAFDGQSWTGRIGLSIEPGRHRGPRVFGADLPSRYRLLTEQRGLRNGGR